MGVNEISVQDFIEKGMLDYSAYVVLQRAIPDIRDGLKPGARRIIYTMNLMKATKLTKSANIEGRVMQLHPHGSTYPTIVNMAQKDRQQIPLIIGKGNFGQATSRDLQAGASRYTEVKLSEASQEMLKDLNKNLVDFVPNYDGTIMMPEVLPVKYPLLLTQPSSGVGVGMASSIPSFNLKELCNAIIKYIKMKKKTMLIPDFATGGYIVNDINAFKKININGDGTFYLRGKATVNGNYINITEIPFSTTREVIIEKIVDLVKSGKLSEISDVKDLTGFKGMIIEIKARRGTDMPTLLEKLYQLTPLQSSFSVNLNVILNKRPHVLSVWQVIDEWIKWRKKTIIRGLSFDVEKMLKELHFLRGLEKVLIDIDEAIKIIRFSKNNEIEKNLMIKFGIDELQAKAVADMKLRNINKDYIIEKIKNIVILENKIKDYKDIISNDERLSLLVVKGLQESSEKYGKDRMTKLININVKKVKSVKKEIEQIPNYTVRLYITKDGYVKKYLGSAKVQEHNLKPGDKISKTFLTENLAELLVFGKDRCCYKIKVYDIEECNQRSLGSFIPSLCEVDKIVGVSVLDSKNKFIIIAYDNNHIAKIKSESFSGNRKKLANSLSKTHEVVDMITFNKEGMFEVKTNTNNSELFETSEFDEKERWTQGVFAVTKGKATSMKIVG